MNPLLTRLKEGGIYFGSQSEGTSHHGGGRWEAGEVAGWSHSICGQEAKRDRVGAHLLFSLPNFYFIQDPSSRFDAEMP